MRSEVKVKSEEERNNVVFAAECFALVVFTSNFGLPLALLHCSRVSTRNYTTQGPVCPYTFGHRA